MNYKTLISNYGQSRLAEDLGTSTAQVGHWVQGVRSVPVKYCQLIKDRINGITLQDLRPKDWRAIWPELSAAVPAGAAPSARVQEA